MKTSFIKTNYEKPGFVKRLLYTFLLLVFLSTLRGLFGFWPLHPLFGLVVFLQLSNKSNLIQKRFILFVLAIGTIYEFIDPIQPIGTQLVASFGAFLAVREASIKFDPPQKLTIPLFTAFYSLFFQLTILLICIHYSPSVLILFKRLILIPILDGLFAFLWFILPKYVITYVKKREMAQQIDA